MKYPNNARLVYILLIFSSLLPRITIASDTFPADHYCNTEVGAKQISCKVLARYKTGNLSDAFVISHRGYWGAPGTAETSLNAVEAAYSADYTITEVDVVLTQDKRLVLDHDQQGNRTTNLPPTPPTAGPFALGNDNDNGSYWRSLNYSSQTSGTVPNPQGGFYDRYPAAKDSYYKDRFGDVTRNSLIPTALTTDLCAPTGASRLR